MAVERLNKHYPGIDLISLLTHVDEVLGTYAEKPVSKRLIIDETPQTHFEIVYSSANHSDPKNGLELIRSFYFKQDILTAKHVYFSLPENARYKGVGTEILAVFLDQYINMGVRQIELLTGLKDGGAVWAKMDFNALYKHEMAEILHAVEEALPGTPQLVLVTRRSLAGRLSRQSFLPGHKKFFIFVQCPVFGFSVVFFCGTALKSL